MNATLEILKKNKKKFFQKYPIQTLALFGPGAGTILMKTAILIF